MQRCVVRPRCSPRGRRPQSHATRPRLTNSRVRAEVPPQLALPASLPRNEHRTLTTSDIPPNPPSDVAHLGVERVVRRAEYQGGMYDALKGHYTFACPTRGEGHANLSDFRMLDRLPGTGHPAVFRVRFICSCGDEHDGLVSHDDLDLAPLGFQAGDFLNLLTDRVDAASDELVDLAVRRIQGGEWPWSFFCYPENQPRPIYPSSFFLLAPGESSVGVAARCPTCSAVSVNLVSHQHVDLPFHNDLRVGVVEHVFAQDALRTLDAFTDELYSATFDERRLSL
jgi:hypothetical protein